MVVETGNKRIKCKFPMESAQDIFSLSKSKRIQASKCIWSWWPDPINGGDTKDREEYGVRREINKE